MEIALKELRSSFTSGRLTAALLISMGLFLLSFVLMTEEYGHRVDNYALSRSLPVEELYSGMLYAYRFADGGSPSSSTSTRPLGRISPPNPLIYVARGLDVDMRQSAHFFQNFPIIDTVFEPDQDANLYRVAFPAPDLLFMIQVGLGLLAVMFSFGIISGEREKGTLKLMLATGASRTSVLGGKMLGNFLSLWIAFTTAWLIYLLLFIVFVVPDPTGEIWIRLAGIYVLACLHILVFFCLGSAISAFTRNSATALVISLFCWAFLIFVVPGLASLVGKQLVPIWSDQKLQEEKLLVATKMEEEYERAHPGSAAYQSGRYGQVHLEIQGDVEKAMAELEDEENRRRDRLVELTSYFSRFSPISSLTLSVASLSGTGLEDQQRFRSDLNEIKSTVLQMKNDNQRSIDLMSAAYTQSFSSPDLNLAIQSASGDVALLVIWAGVLFVIAAVRFGFYDVR